MTALEASFECWRHRVSQLFYSARRTDDYHSRTHRDPLIYIGDGCVNHYRCEFQEAPPAGGSCAISNRVRYKRDRHYTYQSRAQ
jgi:hypothetical protein